MAERKIAKSPLSRGTINTTRSHSGTGSSSQHPHRSPEAPRQASDHKESTLRPPGEAWKGKEARVSMETSTSSADTSIPGKGRDEGTLNSGSGGAFPPRGDVGDPVREPPMGNRDTFLRRLFISRVGRDPDDNSITADAFIELTRGEEEFFVFLDKELIKIETFYREKEEEATERLGKLRKQLNLMRGARADELASRRNSQVARPMAQQSTANAPKKWTNSWVGISAKAAEAAGSFGPLSNSTHVDEQGKHVQIQDFQDVPYRAARRKLKMALVEFYRGLELLKSYAYLNRKAFRKMNKKYDKATNARPTGKYMSEKVNKAWFVQSEVVENHMAAAEELYARYFERGNHKAAAAKLRGKAKKVEDRSANSFRNGLMLAVGVVLAIHGLVGAIHHLNDPDHSRGIQASYILQVRLAIIVLWKLYANSVK